jgi:hypothetical protein
MTTYININGDVRDASSLTVPADRVFRGAWQFNGAAVEIDMDKARDIHRNNLRAERAPKLAALDVAYMKALEQGSITTTIAAQKQALRDVTTDPRIEAAATPDALKALTLDTLLE